VVPYLLEDGVAAHPYYFWREPMKNSRILTILLPIVVIPTLVLSNPSKAYASSGSSAAEIQAKKELEAEAAAQAASQIKIIASDRLKFNPNSIDFPKPILLESSFGKSISLPTTSISSKQSQIAFDFPNFQPLVNLHDGFIEVSIPVSLFEGPINDILRANEGRYKDTDFNRLDVNNMRVLFANGGFNIGGNWRFQHREYLGKIFGRKKYTPWVSVSGSFTQTFNMSVKNGSLSASAGRTDIRGADKWYGSIVNALISKLGINGKVNVQINQGLQQINGMNVQQLLIQASSVKLASALGISQNEAIEMINSHAGSINCSILNGRLIIVEKVQ
jgi:hypothetical protein